MYGVGSALCEPCRSPGIGDGAGHWKNKPSYCPRAWGPPNTHRADWTGRAAPGQVKSTWSTGPSADAFLNSAMLGVLGERRTSSSGGASPQVGRAEALSHRMPSLHEPPTSATSIAGGRSAAIHADVGSHPVSMIVPRQTRLDECCRRRVGKAGTADGGESAYAAVQIRRALSLISES